jgi:hypothetical protein
MTTSFSGGHAIRKEDFCMKNFIFSIIVGAVLTGFSYLEFIKTNLWALFLVSVVTIVFANYLINRINKK